MFLRHINIPLRYINIYLTQCFSSTYSHISPGPDRLSARFFRRGAHQPRVLRMKPLIRPIRPHMPRAQPRRGVTPHNAALSAVFAFCESCSRPHGRCLSDVSRWVLSELRYLRSVGVPAGGQVRGGVYRRPFYDSNYTLARGMPL